MAGKPFDPMADLVRRVLAQRERWVPLPHDGLRVLVRRPARAEMGPFLVHHHDGSRGLRCGIDQVKTCVVGWEGMTEAIVLGPTVGGDEPVPFSPELWAVLVIDQDEWAALVGDAVIEQIVEDLQQAEDASGN